MTMELLASALVYQVSLVHGCNLNGNGNKNGIHGFKNGIQNSLALIAMELTENSRFRKKHLTVPKINQTLTGWLILANYKLLRET